ncbi:MAG TPA: rhomboid family intramembrane serine protease, partial [Pirellulaceae bacterium]
DLFPQVHEWDPMQWQLGPERFLVLPPSKPEIIASIFTAMFLHGNWMHLLGNMWFLWLFGNNIEDRLGHTKYLLLYLLGGVFATAVHWAMSPAAAMVQPLIGASGAVAVVLGAYAVTFPHANVRTLVFILIFITVVDLPALIVLGAWFVIQVVNGAYARPEFGNTVAWWAHAGGFLAGVIVMPFLSGTRTLFPSSGPALGFPSDTEQDPYEPLA